MRRVPLPRIPLRAPILGVLLAFALTGPALAHAVLLDSTPASGGTLPAGHADIRLRFNSRIDAARSRVALSPAGGGGSVLGLGESGRPDVLTCPVELVPGSYLLRWQVLAVDGHITRGTLPFTVQPAAAAGARP
jgi:copper resistance protein C